MLEFRRTAALLRPRGGEEADGEQRLQHRSNDLADPCPGPEFGQCHEQVVSEKKQQPRERIFSEQRTGLFQPFDALPRFASLEMNWWLAHGAGDFWKTRHGDDARAKYALEHRGIVRVRQFARARQMEIVQS